MKDWGETIYSLLRLINLRIELRGDRMSKYLITDDEVLELIELIENNVILEYDREYYIQMLNDIRRSNNE